MHDVDLTPALRQRMASYPRRRGRYNASELYGITHGYITPETWMNPKERTVEEMLRMWNGVMIHENIQKFLPSEFNEVKKEYYYNGITLVAKADHVPNQSEEVWEFKTSLETMTASKPSHDYQARLYCSIFERSSGVVFQPVQDSNGLYLRRIGEVQRNDQWFLEEIGKLYDFHLEVEKLWEDPVF